jgi:Holliday junction resolvasome RuvABC endonuclease subunit
MSIDASTKSTGIAIFNEDSLIYKDCLTATASWSLLKRIVAIVNKIKDVLDKYKVDKIILEEVRPEAAAANIKTWRALMWLQAAINLMLYEEYPTIDVDYLYPSEWRKYCKIK